MWTRLCVTGSRVEQSSGVAIVEMAGPSGRGGLPVGYQRCAVLEFKQFPIRSYGRESAYQILVYTV